MATAIVNQATGNVLTFVRPDRPAGWQPPEGCLAVDEDDLPQGWQMESQEPEPVTDNLAGVPVEAAGGVLQIPTRVAVGSDVQVTDADRGIILRDEAGHDWLLVVANGAATCVQISSSPEVSHEVRKQRIATARKAVGDLKARNKGKTPSVAERLELVEKLLGIA